MLPCLSIFFSSLFSSCFLQSRKEEESEGSRRRAAGRQRRKRKSKLLRENSQRGRTNRESKRGRETRRIPLSLRLFFKVWSSASSSSLILFLFFCSVVCFLEGYTGPRSRGGGEEDEEEEEVFLFSIVTIVGERERRRVVCFLYFGKRRKKECSLLFSPGFFSPLRVLPRNFFLSAFLFFSRSSWRLDQMNSPRSVSSGSSLSAVCRIFQSEKKETCL